MGGLRSGVTASRVVIDGRPELLGLEAELRVECTLGILEALNSMSCVTKQPEESVSE